VADEIAAMSSVGKGEARAWPAVAMDGVGNLIVVWEAEVTGEAHNIHGRLFDAAGAPLTGEFRVNSTISFDQIQPDVARNAAGEFIVVWESDDQDGNQAGVYGQRYTALGASSGDEFRVNLRTVGSQDQASVGIASNGIAVVAFHDALLGVLGRAFDASGASFGGDFRINDPLPLDRTSPAIAVRPNGDFVVAWESDGQDGSGFGIRARMFQGSFLFRDGFESENTAAWTLTVP
jgi:hypothetical protein